MRLHDLDCAYGRDSSEPIDPWMEDDAHWFEMEFCGDDSYFVEARLINAERDEINFYMSKPTAKKIRDFLSRVLGGAHE